MTSSSRKSWRLEQTISGRGPKSLVEQQQSSSSSSSSNGSILCKNNISICRVFDRVKSRSAHMKSHRQIEPAVQHRPPAAYNSFARWLFTVWLWRHRTCATQSRIHHIVLWALLCYVTDIHLISIVRSLDSRQLLLIYRCIQGSLFTEWALRGQSACIWLYSLSIYSWQWNLQICRWRDPWNRSCQHSLAVAVVKTCVLEHWLLWSMPRCCSVQFYQWFWLTYVWIYTVFQKNQAPKLWQ